MIFCNQELGHKASQRAMRKKNRKNRKSRNTKNKNQKKANCCKWVFNAKKRLTLIRKKSFEP